MDPLSNSAVASSGSSTRPSSAAPPSRAPRSGPDARSQVIGGPAWRNCPGSSPRASAAGTTSTRRAETPSIRSRATWLASRRRGSDATVARSASVPGMGGRQSTRVTEAAWASTASANRSAPVHTRAGGRFTGCLRGARGRGGRRSRWRGAPRRPPRRAAGPAGRGPAGRRRCRPAPPPRGRGSRSGAGARAPAGSGSAPWPRTTSSSTTPVSGSARACSRASRRSVGSIIGCARPEVNSSAP